MSPTTRPSRGATEIDLLKGGLVVGMVFGHTVQILGDGWFPFHVLSESVNLVAFPGFLFCFGYAADRAYLSRPAVPWANVGRVAGRCYLAYLVSAVAYWLLIAGDPPPVAVANAVTMSPLAEFAEFLLAFPFVLMTAAIGRPVVAAVTARPWATAAAAAAGFALVCLVPPVDSSAGWVFFLVRVEHGSTFPLVESFPFFLAGAAAARRPWPAWLLLGFVPVVGWFLAVVGSGGEVERFPPSPLWYAASAGAVAVAWAVARTAPAWPGGAVVRFLGRHTLPLLVASNVLLFLGHAVPGCRPLSPTGVVAAAVAQLGVTGTVLAVAFRRRPAAPSAGR